MDAASITTVDFWVTTSMASLIVSTEVIEVLTVVVLVVGWGVIVEPISKVVVVVAVIIASAGVTVVDVVCLSVETCVVNIVTVDDEMTEDVDVETGVEAETVVDGMLTLEAIKGVAET